MNKLNKQLIKLALETLLEQVRDAGDTIRIRLVQKELEVLSKKRRWI